MKVILHYIIVLLLLVSVVTPTQAMTFNTTNSSMSCCSTESEKEIHDCCEITEDSHCGSDSCTCDSMCCASSFTVIFYKQHSQIENSDISHKYGFTDYTVNSPIFPIWTPPNIV